MITLKDKLSHLSYTQACKLLGPQGKQLIQEGGKYDIDLFEHVTELTPSDCTKNYRVLRPGRRLPEGEEKGPCHETKTLHSGFQKIDS